MTPREKALSIFNRHNILLEDNEQALIHSNITINEVISQWEYVDTHLANLGGQLNPNLKYWYQVSQELFKIKF